MQVKRLALSTLYHVLSLSGRFTRDGGITILSYHSIDEHGTPLSVSPRLFNSHMLMMARDKCPTYTMRQVADHLLLGLKFPQRAVAITFDDAFANVAIVAGPLLAQYGLRATIYPVTGMMGRATRWTDRGVALPSLPIMSWDDLAALQRQGWEVGAHSVTHGFLTRYAPSRLGAEMRDSRAALEQRLAAPVTTFAYPQGDYNNRVVQAAHEAGYATAVTVDQGRAMLGSDPMRLPRLLVSNNVTPDRLRASLAPAIGPTYKLANLLMRRVLGRRRWPRRAPGEVDSTGSVPRE